MPLARSRCIWTGVDGSPWYTNMHFNLTEDQAQDAIDTLAYFVTSVQTLIVNTVQWEIEDLVVFLNEATGQPTSAVLGDGLAGTGGSTGEMMGRACQGLVRWNTGQYPVGRQIVGHTYVPGMAEGANGANGRLTTTAQGALQSAANSTITTPGNATPVVYSRKHGAFYSAQSASAWEEWAILRSRRD